MHYQQSQMWNTSPQKGKKPAFHFTENASQKQNGQNINTHIYIYLNALCVYVNHSHNSKHLGEPARSI